MRLFAYIYSIFFLNIIYGQDYQIGDSLANCIPLSLITTNIQLDSSVILSNPVMPESSDINYKRLAFSATVAAGMGSVVHIYQKNAWWANQATKFHIVNDWDYALWIDKAGHFTATHFYAHLVSGVYDAANFSAEKSALFSAITALSWELFIEIEDGFGPDWGFSPGDAISDALGATFYIGQYYYPFLKNFQPKISYYPSKKFLDGKHKGGIIIDDYEGQKYWMSIRMKEILPKSVSDYWPELLMLSAGMGVNHLDGAGGGVREFYLGLDLDFEQIPLYGSFWQFVKNTFNYLHFPMPGIRITPKATFFAFIF
ncbi:MAG: hypothetical protein CO129_03290 [Ignavibacteriales bacterium CG_4_9_14_3_um_filter_34_10]|nr:MAG: hypothetical protein CO129_03290 [Ignavibacteriales bacterium CG_4_9_14_3_um_filter_34_10]